MRFNIQALARDADTDVSDLTSAKRTGPAVWAEGGNGLDIPFDRPLSAAEVEAVTVRLTSATTTEETFRTSAVAYLALSNPSPGDNTAQLQRVTRLLLSMLDPA
jgi:hypothetical protein